MAVIEHDAAELITHLRFERLRRRQDNEPDQASTTEEVIAA